MKIIVTGGAGFIGSHLVKALLGSGHQVLNIDALSYAGNLSSLEDASIHADHEFLHADICNAESLAAAFGRFQPDRVIHLAAESHVDRSLSGSNPFIRTNITGTHCLLEVAFEYWSTLRLEAQTNFRFVHVSTDEVFGSLGSEGQFTEASPYRPSSPYAASKAAADHLARAWRHTHGLPVIVTHCTNNYGPFQHPEKLIPAVILRALREETIPIYGDGQHIRDWLHVTDHVVALQYVSERGVPGDTYAIGANQECRNIHIARQICSVLDELQPRPDRRPYAMLIEHVQDRPGHDLRYAIDASKIRRELGWEPCKNHEQGIRETVQWYLKHPDWVESVLED